MESANQSTIKWNIFARELERILASRGFRLGHLNDRSQIHSEKVRRLQRSLRQPHFNVLSPDELEHVGDVFEFTPGERLHLRAAILATAVEDMLMNRIEASLALVAADQVFDILLDAMQAHSEEAVGIGAVKGGNSLPAMRLDDPSFEANALEEAVTVVDHTYILLNLALDEGKADRNCLALLAQTGFEYALVRLSQEDISRCNEDEVSFWRNEAQRGLHMAKQQFRRWNLSNQA